MKSNAEVRSYRDDLRRIIAEPCHCEGLALLLCMNATERLKEREQVLSWVLGDNVDLDESVRRAANVALVHKPERN